MRIKKILFLSVLVFAVSAFTVFQFVNWKVKDGYSVMWDGAAFKDLRAAIIFDEANPGRSRITASVDARTVNTGNSLKDAHIKEALAADKFPFITFASTAIAKNGNGYEATGKLTIKGVTKEIRLPFVFDSKKATDQFPFFPKETFSGKLIIVPKDFNITMTGAPALVVIELVIPVTK